MKRRDSLKLFEGGGQVVNKSIHGANYYWICIKSYFILLWEGDVKRIIMWGQSLESESAEAQRHKVQQKDLILKRARVQCPVFRDFKSTSPRSNPQIRPERQESSAEHGERVLPG